MVFLVCEQRGTNWGCTLELESQEQARTEEVLEGGMSSRWVWDAVGMSSTSRGRGFINAYVTVRTDTVWYEKSRSFLYFKVDTLEVYPRQHELWISRFLRVAWIISVIWKHPVDGCVGRWLGCRWQHWLGDNSRHHWLWVSHFLRVAQVISGL